MPFNNCTLAFYTEHSIWYVILNPVFICIVRNVRWFINLNKYIDNMFFEREKSAHGYFHTK